MILYDVTFTAKCFLLLDYHQHCSEQNIIRTYILTRNMIRSKDIN